MKYSYTLDYKCGENRFSTVDGDNNVEIITDKENINIKIIPHKRISEIGLKIVFNYEFDKNSVVYCNGFQSWSLSREYLFDEKYEQYPIIKPVLKSIGATKIGNDAFVSSATGHCLISTSHCYIRKLKDNNIDLFGSADDRLGYTTFILDRKNDTITIIKDFEGLELSGETNLIKIINIKDIYENAFDRYFTQIGVIKPVVPKLKGYSSWYNYYRNINESIILRDLNAITSTEGEINAFQIDDGYQPFVGDITAVDKVKFPNGMRPIADAIHEKGLLAGIWVCPFGVTKSSDIFKKHNDWLVKNAKGKPIKTGIAWGGFYALDFYNEEVKKYVKESLAEIINVWGFDFLKLDFLYAVATEPRNNKTRATIMYEAMEFLRDCVGDKYIIGCGAPIMPSYNKVEYMRIGADCTFHWAKPYDYIMREMISTSNTLVNTIYRRYYNERVFMNDPDVYYLRDSNVKMSKSQKELHATVCKLFGSVLFNSDNTTEYSDSAKEFYNSLTKESEITINTVELIARYTVEIKYSINDNDRLLVFNYKNGDVYRMQ